MVPNAVCSLLLKLSTTTSELSRFAPVCRQRSFVFKLLSFGVLGSYNQLFLPLLPCDISLCFASYALSGSTLQMRNTIVAPLQVSRSAPFPSVGGVVVACSTFLALHTSYSSPAKPNRSSYRRGADTDDTVKLKVADIVASTRSELLFIINYLYATQKK